MPDAALGAMYSSRYNLYLRFERIKVVHYFWPDGRITTLSIADYRCLRLLSTFYRLSVVAQLGLNIVC